MHLGWVLKGKYGLPRQMRGSDREEQSKGPKDQRTRQDKMSIVMMLECDACIVMVFCSH